MRKKCYSLTYLGPNGNGGSDFRINSQIWLDSSADTGAPLSQPELVGFADYLQSELRRVWSTANNPGLSSGNGPYVYNNTNDTFTCDPPTGSPAHSRDTGIVVNPINGRTPATARVPHAILPNIRKRQNEIIFDVFRNRPPNKRAHINPKKQEGELYYYQQAPAPPMPGTPPPPVIAYNENGFNVDGDPFYLDIHNTPAHEFGHALGLADRYHYLAFGHHNTNNANTNGNSSRNWIARHGGGDVPMYLPGFYDHNIPAGSSFNEPPYDQEPYEAGSPTPNNEMGSEPQDNFDLNTAGHKPAYDIDYTSRFGWEHNIMSRKLGINDPQGLSTSRFSGEYVTAGVAADDLYTDIYGLEIGVGLPEVVLITETQTKVITDTGGPTTDLPSVGGEIISKRFEDKRAEDEGYPEGMFDQYIFVIGAGNTMSNQTTPLIMPFIGSQLRDPSERGIPPRILAAILGLTPTPLDKNKAFYNTKSGGTFIGLHYTDKLDKNGNGAKIVCDWEFNQAAHDQVKGITDCMDYRISEMETSGANENKWTPKFWDVTPGGINLAHFNGFINPGIAAKRNPKSRTRSYILGKANAGVVAKNIEISGLDNTLFFNILDDVYSSQFPTYFSNGLESINNLTLAFGTPEPLRCIQRILQQANNPTDRSIMNGAFSTTDGKFNYAQANGMDIFAEAGIAAKKGRSYWNASRNDIAPPIPNPGPTGTVSVPPNINVFNNPLPTITLIAGTLFATAWTFKEIGYGKITYIISFSSTMASATAPLPANYALLPRYEITVRYFSNREIIETMALPS